MFRTLSLGLVAFVFGLSVINTAVASTTATNTAAAASGSQEIGIQAFGFQTEEEDQQTSEFLKALSTLRDAGLITDQEIEKEFTIKEITIVESNQAMTNHELAARGFDIKLPGPKNNDGKGLTGSLGTFGLSMLGDLKTWITLGPKLWTLIEANAPVVNVQTQSVSVLPAGIAWTDMETWKGPAAKTYSMTAKNVYGVAVVSQSYTVAYNYGGSVAGKGQFLANATIIPTAIKVSWGFKLASELRVGNTLNTGTYENPVPGVDLTVHWTFHSVMSHVEGREQFFVRGDGSNTHVTLN